MHKVVFNNCYGGFSLSISAIAWLEHNCTDKELKLFIKQVFNEGGNLHIQYAVSDYFCNKRHHKDLVAVVEALGPKANGSCASLSICNIDTNQYRIEEYDGAEDVVTPDGENWIFIED
jgi:hypothetical protein